LRLSIRQTFRKGVAALPPQQDMMMSDAGALHQVARTKQSTTSFAQHHWHRHALLSTRQYTRQRIRGVSLRSFSTVRRESTNHSEDEEANEISETKTQDQPASQEQSSSTTPADVTRQLLRSVLQRTNDKQKAIIADRPFNKKSANLKADPKEDWPLHRDLQNHIRACLPDIQFESRELGTRDTGLSVCLLGTGAGVGSRLRSNAATVVRHDGNAYLVDAGEGVSKQFYRSRVGTAAVRKIFSKCCCSFEARQCHSSWGGAFNCRLLACVLACLLRVFCYSENSRLFCFVLACLSSYTHARRSRLWLARIVIESPTCRNAFG